MGITGLECLAFHDHCLRANVPVPVRCGCPLQERECGGEFDPQPGVGDLDGDLDALVGNRDGFITYFKNTGPPTAPTFVQQTGPANPLDGVNVGSLSTPCLGDVDGDGDLDAVVGELDGFLNYYQNTGTARAPVFVEQTGPANPFNGVELYISAPSLGDVDGDGDLDAVVGERDGFLNYFKNVGTATTPSYAVQEAAANPFNGVDAGTNSAPSLGDLDGMATWMPS